jgi:putative transposase
VLAATDFFTVEVATGHGLVTSSGLIVMVLATRRLQMAGITPYPTTAFRQRCARELTEPVDGFLLGKRYLLHDRDTKDTPAFAALLKDSGVEPPVLPPRRPHLNAHGARCVRSIGEESRRVVLTQSLAHDHAERNHQGLDNQLIAPASDVGSCSGHIRRRVRLGGLLSYYDRDAA